MIRQIIRNSLVHMQHFRHEYSSIFGKILKKRNKIKRHSITCSHIWYFDILVLISYTISECLVEIQTIQTWMVNNNVWKFPKKRNKIKWPSITCSHIWYVDILIYVNWLDIHSVKVWWKYVFPNANAAHFCDIIFRT